jgi:hypothetical protein
VIRRPAVRDVDRLPGREVTGRARGVGPSQVVEHLTAVAFGHDGEVVDASPRTGGACESRSGQGQVEPAPYPSRFEGKPQQYPRLPNLDVVYGATGYRWRLGR